MGELIRDLKRRGVLTSPYVEAAFRAIDRADFVLPEYRGEAYQDYPLPIGHGQTISQPYTVAFMLDLLDPRPGERILDIGAGSGWQTTLLAHVVSKEGNGARGKGNGTVYAVERIPELCAFARTNISHYNFLGRGTIEFRCGDATGGWPDEAPFDKIIAAAAGDELPDAWRGELAVGGVIVAPVGNSMRRCEKRSETEWDETEFPGFAFVPLIRGKAGEQKPVRREGRDRRRPFLIFCSLLAVLAAFSAFALLAPVALGETVQIEIAPGSGLRAIASLLKSRGLIRSKWTFVAYAALTGRAYALKPGGYAFSGRVALPTAVAAVAAGESNERTITIPEGWDLRDIGRYLEEAGVVPARELWAITGEPARRPSGTARFPPPGAVAALPSAVAAKPPAATLEGYLYPDTYRVFRDASAADIIGKMLENFERKLTPELRHEIERQGKTIAAVITVASLLEREVADPDDRRTVAGILWRRLAIGMPLQVDATVNYITGKRKTPSAEDLAVDSPYNTYRHAGLPPTPIANPGEDAIRAAIHPRQSSYAYYLSSPDGRTVFSATLREHAAAKARYLR